MHIDACISKMSTEVQDTRSQDTGEFVIKTKKEKTSEGNYYPLTYGCAVECIFHILFHPNNDLSIECMRELALKTDSYKLNADEERHARNKSISHIVLKKAGIKNFSRERLSQLILESYFNSNTGDRKDKIKYIIRLVQRYFKQNSSQSMCLCKADLLLFCKFIDKYFLKHNSYIESELIFKKLKYAGGNKDKKELHRSYYEAHYEAIFGPVPEDYDEPGYCVCGAEIVERCYLYYKSPLNTTDNPLPTDLRITVGNCCIENFVDVEKDCNNCGTEHRNRINLCDQCIPICRHCNTLLSKRDMKNYCKDCHGFWCKTCKVSFCSCNNDTFAKNTETERKKKEKWLIEAIETVKVSFEDGPIDQIYRDKPYQYFFSNLRTIFCNMSPSCPSEVSIFSTINRRKSNRNISQDMRELLQHHVYLKEDATYFQCLSCKQTIFCCTNHNIEHNNNLCDPCYEKKLLLEIAKQKTICIIKEKIEEKTEDKAKEKVEFRKCEYTRCNIMAKNESALCGYHFEIVGHMKPHCHPSRDIGSVISCRRCKIPLILCIDENCKSNISYHYHDECMPCEYCEKQNKIAVECKSCENYIYLCDDHETIEYHRDCIPCANPKCKKTVGDSPVPVKCYLCGQYKVYCDKCKGKVTSTKCRECNLCHVCNKQAIEQKNCYVCKETIFSCKDHRNITKHSHCSTCSVKDCEEQASCFVKCKRESCNEYMPRCQTHVKWNTCDFKHNDCVRACDKDVKHYYKCKVCLNTHFRCDTHKTDKTCVAPKNYPTSYKKTRSLKEFLKR